MGRRRHSACLALLLLCGCALRPSPGEHFEAHETTYAALPGWTQDDQAPALAAFLRTCPKLTAAQDASPGSGLHIAPEMWQSLCGEAARLRPGDDTQARQFFERRFVPFRLGNNGNAQGLFTGYYEPLLYGSYKKHGDFIYPVYTAPPELKNGQPLASRREIYGGALAGRHLELLWVDDPVMLFFMQVQGSGHIHMSDGSRLLIGYAGKNGQPYVSLGKIAGDEGLIPKDKINFFSLRQWMYEHPDRAFDLMQRNPSYVFLRRLDGKAPVGAAGAELTPQRSLAVDNRYIPYGLPLFVETELPAMPQETPLPFQHLLVAQDTGSAILGPVRGDIYFGEGDAAEYYAGTMHGHGTYSLLVPREAAGQLR